VTGAFPVPLRPLRADDVPRVAELERELFGPSAWSEAMIRGELTAPGRWYVAADDPTDAALATGVGPDSPGAGSAEAFPGTPLVGYAGLWFDGDVTQVMTIGVAPGMQRQGIGTALLQALLERSRDLGATAVLLEVRVDNGPAIALYERLGFATVSRRKRYYQPEDVDGWTMRLELGTPEGDVVG